MLASYGVEVRSVDPLGLRPLCSLPFFAFNHKRLYLCSNRTSPSNQVTFNYYLKGNLSVKFKRDIRHAFSGWKITNARLAGKYLCTAVNLDSLDLGLRFLDLSEEQTQSSFTSRKRKRDCL